MGSIYALKDGTVVGHYEVGAPSGKKRRYVRGKNREDVDSKLSKAMAERDSWLV